MKNTRIQAPSPRIIDVNVNRLSEALRVIEDVIRFHIRDESLSNRVKSIRASFDLFRKEQKGDMLFSRESEIDFGRKMSYDKNNRDGIESILGSAFGRAQESSRVLEEFSKINKHSTERMKEMRYSLYDIERVAVILLHRRKFTNDMGLYLIMTNPKIGYEKLTEAAVKMNIKVIQLRDKIMEGRELLRTAKAIKSIVKNSDTLFIVNDRLDIALLSDADGVHLGQTDIPVEEARKISKDLIIGKSTHNSIQLKKALKEQPDYVGIGPIYPTDSKKIKDRVLGFRNAKSMLEASSVPSVGIGGIKDHNIKDVLNIGFTNIAVLSFITESGNPIREIKKIQSALRRKNDIKR
ncbi:TPA: thiamine phosphate synthase [candidate division WOR-3 bacterium]|uniref:Thiamine-phosphate synthase n=1 Tax=candidate division WOR-3 bacterium TaxID=2052148 RepID=A0A350HAL5_UNCW3|nr:thiamine phosphate synthase [candidate division WOR-3 bacterium]